MENKQTSFMFYDNFLEAIDQLPENKRANACYLFCRYALTGELPQDESLSMFCIGVRYSVRKYQGRGGARDGAGAPKGNKNASKNKELEQFNQNNQNNQNIQNIHNNQKQQTETETKTETKTEAENKTEIETSKIASNFLPPSEDEVLDYAKKMNEMAGCGGFKCDKITALEFYSRYKSNGWILGNGIPMRDWQATLKLWCLREAVKK